MDGKQLLEIIKAEKSGLFGKMLTDETATALLSAAFRAVREQVQGTEEGLLRIEGLGTFRIKRVERGEGEERVVRKVVVLILKQIAEPRLADIADRHYGKAKGGYSRKPESYITEYERMFAAIRHKPLRILELGVRAGESLLIWRDYFPNAVIVGIDIDDKPQRIAIEPRIHFVKGSQDDPTTLDAAAAISGQPFDIIIDDASHIGYLTKRSLYYLFPRWLKPGGHYVIEDIGAAFLASIPDGTRFPKDELDDIPQTKIFRSHQHGILGVVKQVVDQTMKGMITKSPSILAIDRITLLANIAIIRKAVGRTA